MLTYNEQLKKFKHLIPIGPRPVSDLIDILKSKISVKEISPLDLPRHALSIHQKNVFYFINNEKLHIAQENMVFRVFKILNDEQIRAYLTNEDLLVKSDNMHYVIFEEKTGYIASSINRLFLELELARGVSQDEINNEGLEFRSLLSHIAMAHCKE